MNKILFYKGIYIKREYMPTARKVYDLYITEEGIGANFVWQHNTVRLPIIHPILDSIKRLGRNGKSPEQLIKANPNNLYYKFENIQGIVSDRSHKELQVLTDNEEFKIHFRKIKRFDELIKLLEEKIPDKIHSRDSVKITQSVYLGKK